MTEDALFIFVKVSGTVLVLGAPAWGSLGADIVRFRSSGPRGT